MLNLSNASRRARTRVEAGSRYRERETERKKKKDSCISSRSSCRNTRRFSDTPRHPLSTRVSAKCARGRDTLIRERDVPVLSKLSFLDDNNNESRIITAARVRAIAFGKITHLHRCWAPPWSLYFYEAPYFFFLKYKAGERAHGDDHTWCWRGF